MTKRKRVLVLGGGLVGLPMAEDIAASNPDVVVDVVDLERRSGKGIVCHQLDFGSIPDMRDALETCDVIVNALPGEHGYVINYSLLQNAVPKKDKCKTIVDISFSPQSPTDLHEAAVAAGVTLVPDIGVAPGMMGVLLGHEAAGFDTIDSYECYVGGMPKDLTPPAYYKAPFSPRDVIEEYTRPARHRKNGVDTKLTPLNTFGDIEVPNQPMPMGCLLTDGLRTLLTSYPDIPYMSEWTIRHWGHIKDMWVMERLGFFSPEHLDNTAKVLTEQWKFNSNTDPDFLYLKVCIEGERGGKRRRVVWTMYDEHDGTTSAMARTTGYTAAGVVHHAMNNTMASGVVLPEHLGSNDYVFLQLRDYLSARGVAYERTES